MKLSPVINTISFAGVAGFLLIVLYLHSVQKGYDPVHQLMSELALGSSGGLMLAAFSSLALSFLALAAGTAIKKSWLLCGNLVFASLCFLGAGFFPLGATSELHILLVAAAFIAVGVSMYVLPYYADISHRRLCRQYSWGLLSMFALAAGVGSSVVSMGISQRFAAIAMLLWVLMTAQWLRISSPFHR